MGLAVGWELLAACVPRGASVLGDNERRTLP